VHNQPTGKWYQELARCSPTFTGSDPYVRSKTSDCYRLLWVQSQYYLIMSLC